MAEPGMSNALSEKEAFGGIMDLLNEISTCLKADATVAAVAMIYICIDTMAFLAMPAGQTVQGKRDFVAWVDTYLKTEAGQPYEYRGIDVYAARCALLHAFSAETEAHRKDLSIVRFGYTDNGPHKFDPAIDSRLAMISAMRLFFDLSAAVARFVEGLKTDVGLRKRVAARLPALYATFPINRDTP
jgi:hypothetical protein